MRWFVAKDKSGDTYLYMCEQPVVKSNTKEAWVFPTGVSGKFLFIGTSVLPECKWEDEEPLELEFSIKKDEEIEEKKSEHAEYEYQICLIEHGTPTQFTKYLNGQGKDGWELVNYNDVDWKIGVSKLIFKRKKV